MKNDKVAIEQLLDQMAHAWNRGDGKSYGARYLGDATFTNVNGAFFVGKYEFDCRHEEIFRGVFQGTKLNLSIKTLRFVRSDVAIADIDAALAGCLAKPPGVPFSVIFTLAFLSDRS